MIVLGLLLVLLAVGVGAAVAATGTAAVTVDVLGFGLDTDARLVFFAGAATVLVALVGLALLRHGLRRANRRRKEHRSLRREVRARQDTTSPPRSGTEPTRRPGRVDEQFDTAPKE